MRDHSITEVVVVGLFKKPVTFGLTLGIAMVAGEPVFPPSLSPPLSSGPGLPVSVISVWIGGGVRFRECAINNRHWIEFFLDHLSSNISTSFVSFLTSFTSFRGSGGEGGGECCSGFSLLWEFRMRFVYGVIYTGRSHNLSVNRAQGAGLSLNTLD
jgi:hypothetical protein